MKLLRAVLQKIMILKTINIVCSFKNLSLNCRFWSKCKMRVDTPEAESNGYDHMSVQMCTRKIQLASENPFRLSIYSYTPLYRCLCIFIHFFFCHLFSHLSKCLRLLSCQKVCHLAFEGISIRHKLQFSITSFKN